MKPWVIFLVLSWGFVLSLVSWAYWRLLSDQGQKHFDPDGVGPAAAQWQWTLQAADAKVRLQGPVTRWLHGPGASDTLPAGDYDVHFGAECRQRAHVRGLVLHVRRQRLMA